MKRPNELVSSRQNSLVKLTASLTDRKFREREGLFRFDGKKLFLEALDSALPLFAVLLRESAADVGNDLRLGAALGATHQHLACGIDLQRDGAALAADDAVGVFHSQIKMPDR